MKTLPAPLTTLQLIGLSAAACNATVYLFATLTLAVILSPQYIPTAHSNVSVMGSTFMTMVIGLSGFMYVYGLITMKKIREYFHGDNKSTYQFALRDFKPLSVSQRYLVHELSLVSNEVEGYLTKTKHRKMSLTEIELAMFSHAITKQGVATELTGTNYDCKPEPLSFEEIKQCLKMAENNERTSFSKMGPYFILLMICFISATTLIGNYNMYFWLFVVMIIFIAPQLNKHYAAFKKGQSIPEDLQNKVIHQDVSINREILSDYQGYTVNLLKICSPPARTYFLQVQEMSESGRGCYHMDLLLVLKAIMHYKTTDNKPETQPAT